jgi:hypothetical protein
MQVGTEAEGSKIGMAEAAAVAAEAQQPTATMSDDPTDNSNCRDRTVKDEGQAATVEQEEVALGRAPGIVKAEIYIATSADAQDTATKIVDRDHARARTDKTDNRYQQHRTDHSGRHHRRHSPTKFMVLHDKPTITATISRTINRTGGLIKQFGHSGMAVTTIHFTGTESRPSTANSRDHTTAATVTEPVTIITAVAPTSS